MRSEVIKVQEKSDKVTKPGLDPLPEAHPLNCKNECPYGKGKSFCWPCMNKILAEHRAGRTVSVDG